MTVVATNPGNATRAIATVAAITLAAWGAMAVLHDKAASQDSAVLIWMVMTVGMMAPSAIPMIATFSKIGKKLDGSRSTQVLSVVFLFAYLLVWAIYGLVAAFLQSAMRERSLVDEHLALTNPVMAAGLLAAAGLYQLLPAKSSCLRKCRSPLGFLMSAYQPGYRHAFSIGVRHGAFCLGCCWLLMALAWVGGVMNMPWMAMLSAIAVLEKTFPAAVALEKFISVLLLGFALLLLPLPNEKEAFLLHAAASLCHSHW